MEDLYLPEAEDGPAGIQVQLRVLPGQQIIHIHQRIMPLWVVILVL